MPFRLITSFFPPRGIILDHDREKRYVRAPKHFVSFPPGRQSNTVLLEEGNVLSPFMVRVTCHIPITPIRNPSRRSAKRIPNRGPSTVLTRRPFNLKRRTGKPVQKVRWQGHAVKPLVPVEEKLSLSGVGRCIYVSGV